MLKKTITGQSDGRNNATVSTSEAPERTSNVTITAAPGASAANSTGAAAKIGDGGANGISGNCSLSDLQRPPGGEIIYINKAPVAEQKLFEDEDIMPPPSDS